MARQTRLIMGMPVMVEIMTGDAAAGASAAEAVYRYLTAVDARFSTYKPDSEISVLNRGEIALSKVSAEMAEVLEIADRTRRESDGYFSIMRPDGRLDPSGVVKGWAVRNAAKLIRKAGHSDFFVDAGGDIQSAGVNAEGASWRVGIRNPFDARQIIKVVTPRGAGVATSGSYVRGDHIYDPHQPGTRIADIISLTVIGADVLEADRFATAAFAMGRAGIHFIERQRNLEGYLVDAEGVATQTTGFGTYVSQ